MSSLRLKKLGFESPVVTHAFYLALEKRFGKDLRPTADLVETLRILKDEEEARCLRKSAQRKSRISS